MYCQVCGTGMKELEGDVNFDAICPGCNHKSNAENLEKHNTLTLIEETVARLESKVDDLHTIVSGIGT